MKKLIYLLVLCLCMGGLTAAVPDVSRSAMAEDAAGSEAEEKQAEEEAAKQKAAEEEAARKKAAEEEAAKKKAAEEEAARQKAAEEEAARQKAAEEEAARQKAAEEEAARQKAAEEEAARQKAAEEEAARQKAAEEEAARQKAAEEEAERQRAAEEEAEQQKAAEEAQKSEKAKAEKKDKGDKKEEEKEQEYPLDLAKSGQFLLSEALEVAKTGIRVGDIKAIEPENKGVGDLLAWEPASKGSDDYVVTVLQNFKEAKLRIRTKKLSLILVLENGAKAEESEEKKEAEVADAKPARTSGSAEPEKQEQTEVENGGSEGEPSGDAGTEPEVGQESQAEAGDGQEPALPEEPASDQTSGETDAVDQTSAEQPSGEQAVGETAAEDQAIGEQTADAPAAEDPSAGEQTADAPTAEDPQAGEQGGEGQPSGEDAGEQTPADAETVPDEAEAWFQRDGEAPAWGTLAEVVGMLTGGETVNIRSASKLLLQAAPLQLLASVTLQPDGGVFDETYALRISRDDPDVVQEPQLIDPATLGSLGDSADLYIWVGKVPETPPEPVDPDKPVLAVAVNNYVEAAWSVVKPEFTLSGIPEGKSWSYAAIIYDERIVPISGNVYAPEEQGKYSLRFAMLDELGDVMCVSDQYTLWLDWTPPEDVSIIVDEEKNYTLYVIATDSASGVEAVSLNDGKLWEKLGNEEIYTYTGKSDKTFDEGSIQVRDAAGNIYISTEEYEVTEVEEEEEEDDGGGGGGGGGGGDGTSKPVLSHASGDGEEGSEYDAVTLEVPDEPMEQLTVGGEPMQLTLMLESAEQPDAPVGHRQPFTASLRRWNGTGGTPDTLLLNAEIEANLGDRFTYEWRFNGEVYRLLANSGIKYVALRVGNDVAAFPTEGFTGGTKYTELKMLGVSTKKFDYTLAMRVNLDPGHMSTMSDSDYSQECDLSIHTEVENMDYELSSSPNSIMYFYNVYLGPEDMLDHPFGEYRA